MKFKRGRLSAVSLHEIWINRNGNYSNLLTSWKNYYTGNDVTFNILLFFRNFRPPRLQQVTMTTE